MSTENVDTAREGFPAALRRDFDTISGLLESPGAALAATPTST
jgi:hypothetical protein